MTLNKQFCITSLLPVLTALAVTLFFGLCYPHHLHYQEQFQLFLFDSDYALDVMCVPGGVADYLGRFITQFFLYAWVGATLIGLLIGRVQHLAAKTVDRSWLYFLSLVPAILLVRALCDENVLVGGIIAILFDLEAAHSICTIDSDKMRRIVSLAILPLLYWAVGPMVYLYAILVVIDELRRGFNLRICVFMAALLILTLAIPAFVAKFVAIEPQYLYKGVHYLRSHDANDTDLWLAVVSCVLPTLMACSWKKGIRPANRIWQPALLAVILGVAGSAALVYPNINSKAETGMAYDFMARMQLWNKMQRMAEKQAPNNALCATALNLSLAKTEQLGERMFSFPQNGISGLLPEMARDAMSPLITSEVYYHLGMINTAQRYVFEAQEAILDFQKSGRCYKRLAETNLICGNYAVARKYLLSLQKTLFYRDWANSTLQLLGNEEAINQHKEYGVLRQNLYKEDEFFSNGNYAILLQKLFESNKNNRMAYEYTLAACLLQKDFERFVKVYSMNDAIAYQSTPTHFQEALILWQSFGTGSKLPLKGIRPDIESGLRQFVVEVERYQNKPQPLAKRYGKTYWYYYLTH